MNSYFEEWLFFTKIWWIFGQANISWCYGPKITSKLIQFGPHSFIQKLLCCCLYCGCCSSSDNVIPTPPEEPPPYYPENRIAYINVTQSGQNQISYSCETTPQFPQFPQRTSMPKNQNLKTNISAQNGTNLSPTHIPSSLSPLPPIPPPYTENSKGEWINGTWVRHV